MLGVAHDGPYAFYTFGSLNNKKGAIVSQHMVIFQNPDGHPGYNQFESVEEAVAFVEKLRNEQSIDSIRIFELNELKFDLKPYYKVQMQALNAGSPNRPSPAPDSWCAHIPGPFGFEPRCCANSGARQRKQPLRRAGQQPRRVAAGARGSTAAESGTDATPVPPADQPAEEEQPTRRGLFGR